MATDACPSLSATVFGLTPCSKYKLAIVCRTHSPLYNGLKQKATLRALLRTMSSTPEFSIDRFMENRWLDAAEILTELDPAFVHALEVQDSVIDEGLWLPYKLPSPSKRLPLEWHQLLESTADIVQHIDRWTFMLEKAEAAADYRESIVYLDTWIELGWSLADKVNRLISLTCKVYSLGQRRAKYLKDTDRIKDNFGKLRHPLVHGASDPLKGEKGVNARAMTEEGYWETAVVSGFPNMKPYLCFSREKPPSSLIPGARPTTNNVFGQLGAILASLEEDIERVKSHQHQPRFPGC